MNDGNDKHEGAWWGNLETLKPSQVQSDYSYVDEDDRRKKFIIRSIHIKIEKIQEFFIQRATAGIHGNANTCLKINFAVS